MKYGATQGYSSGRVVEIMYFKEESFIKIAVVYFSKTGNTKKVAELIAEGAKIIEKVEVKCMSIEEADNEFLMKAKTVIFASPTILDTFSW